MLSIEWSVPILDMGNTQLLLSQGRIVQVIEFTFANPAVECVFLDANLETVWIILVLGQKRGHE